MILCVLIITNKSPITIKVFISTAIRVFIPIIKQILFIMCIIYSKSINSSDVDSLWSHQKWENFGGADCAQFPKPFLNNIYK